MSKIQKSGIRCVNVLMILTPLYPDVHISYMDKDGTEFCITDKEDIQHIIILSHDEMVCMNIQEIQYYIEHVVRIGINASTK